MSPPEKRVKSVADMRRAERLWEALDYWTSFDRAPLTDEQYNAYTQRILQLDSEDESSWSASGDRLFTEVAWAVLGNPRQLKSWRDRISMRERARSAIDKLNKSIEDALDGNGPPDAIWPTRLWPVVERAKADVAHRCHDERAHEQRHFEHIHLVMIKIMRKVVGIGNDPSHLRKAPDVLQALLRADSQRQELLKLWKDVLGRMKLRSDQMRPHSEAIQAVVDRLRLVDTHQKFYQAFNGMVDDWRERWR